MFSEVLKDTKNAEQPGQDGDNKNMVTHSQSTASISESREWTRHLGPVTSVALIPGTRNVVTSAYDSAVGCFNLDTGKVELLGYHDHLVNSITVNSEGTFAASCSSDYSICIWDLKKRNKLHSLKGHDDDVEDFAFVDSETGVSASRDRRMIVWNLRTGTIRRILEGHEKDVLAVAAQGDSIYSAGDDKTLRVWNLDTGAELKVWGPFEDETDTCAIDPQHQRVILGCDDGCIRIFDILNGKLIQIINGHNSGIKFHGTINASSSAPGPTKVLLVEQLCMLISEEEYAISSGICTSVNTPI